MNMSTVGIVKEGMRYEHVHCRYSHRRNDM